MSKRGPDVDILEVVACNEVDYDWFVPVDLYPTAVTALVCYSQTELLRNTPEFSTPDGLEEYWCEMRSQWITESLIVNNPPAAYDALLCGSCHHTRCRSAEISYSGRGATELDGGDVWVDVM